MYADWEKPTDIQSAFGTTDLLGKSSNRVVFDIGGNNYRMIWKYAFGDKQVHLFICRIGTHAEYDDLCENNKQYTVNNFKFISRHKILVCLLFTLRTKAIFWLENTIYV